MSQQAKWFREADVSAVAVNREMWSDAVAKVRNTTVIFTKHKLNSHT